MKRRPTSPFAASQRRSGVCFANPPSCLVGRSAVGRRPSGSRELAASAGDVQGAESGVRLPPLFVRTVAVARLDRDLPCPARSSISTLPRLPVFRLPDAGSSSTRRLAALPAAARGDGRTNGWTNGRTDGRSSPIKFSGFALRYCERVAFRVAATACCCSLPRPPLLRLLLQLLITLPLLLPQRRCAATRPPSVVAAGVKYPRQLMVR